MRTSGAVALILLCLAGCGSSGKTHTPVPRPTRTVPEAAPVHHATIQALVTAPTENELIAVEVPSGRVARHIRLPARPEYVATCCNGGPVVVASSGAGAVTLLDPPPSLRVVNVLHGFDAPHIVEISPDANYAYVTDDAAGRVDVIGLYDNKLVGGVEAGAGAHHLSFAPDQHQAWVALGQSAGTIVILDTAANPARPRPTARFEPGFLAHMPVFSPDGREVWVTSAAGPNVEVLSARTHRVLFGVRAGAPPQHIVFAGGYAYITSGYGSSIERVTLTGRVVRRVRAPYGSFELDAGAGFVVTASLLRGTLAIYDANLRRLHIVTLAPSLEDVAIASSP
jgi:DNA-binding beta-propeller fold protein YncE